MVKKYLAHRISLVQALTWIVASTVLVAGLGHHGVKAYFKWQHSRLRDSEYHITSLVQTGPQKEALKCNFLAELIGLSADRPVSSLRFNLEAAQQRLLRSPLLREAHVKLLGTQTLFVDYTVRQPVAMVYDFENVAIDQEGYLFPFSPFFSPKNLPQIYLGSAPFGKQGHEPDRAIARWGEPYQDRYMTLAMDLLRLVKAAELDDLFTVHRIAVSNAFSASCGTREIILMVRDEVVKKEGSIFFPRILRLSTKNYAQELANFLRLRQSLLDKEMDGLSQPSVAVQPVKVIDFRLPQLAFIEETK